MPDATDEDWHPGVRHRDPDRERPILKTDVRLQDQLAAIEANLMREITVLSHDVRVDGRWLSIAKTDLEKGFLELRHAMKDMTRG